MMKKTENLFSRLNLLRLIRKKPVVTEEMDVDEKEVIGIENLDSNYGLLEDKLETLLAGSEEKFLHIGDALQNFSGKARELSRLSVSATELTSGEEISSAIGGLQGHLERTSQLLGEEEGYSGGSLEKLKNIMNTINWLGKVCGEFNKLTQTLRILSVAIEIENARIDQHQHKTNFISVSEDIRTLSNLIDNKSDNILKNSMSLAVTVEKAIKKTEDLSKLQKSSTVKMLNEAQASLESLINLNNMSEDVSSRVAVRSSEICKNIGDVVASLQFHDITRQQIEHVRDILKEVSGKCRNTVGDNNHTSKGENLEALGWMSSVCNIQVSQLLCIKKELCNAVNNVIESLKGISNNVEKMMVDTQTLSGGASQTGDSHLSKVEDGITAVIQALQENEKIEKEISDSVTTAVNGMAGFVEDIEGVSAQIKLIAINAQVQAERVGEEGKPFVVLAEELQLLSANARSHTFAVLERLNLMTGKGEKSDNDGSPISNQAETENKSTNLGNMLKSMNRINFEFMNYISQITENGQTLEKEIRVLTDGIEIHDEMSLTLEDVANSLSESVERIQELYPDLVSYVETANVDSLKDYYTTESERNIHMTVTGGLSDVIALEVDPPDEDQLDIDLFESDEISESEEEVQIKKIEVREEDDMGDNIELF